MRGIEGWFELMGASWRIRLPLLMVELALVLEPNFGSKGTNLDKLVAGIVGWN